VSDPPVAVPGVNDDHHPFFGGRGCRPMDLRGALDADGLLRIILVLVVIYLVVNIAFDVIEFAFGPLSNIIGLIIIVVIVLYFLDYI
jgi:hypothetical protein